MALPFPSHSFYSSSGAQLACCLLSQTLPKTKSKATFFLGNQMLCVFWKRITHESVSELQKHTLKSKWALFPKTEMFWKEKKMVPSWQWQEVTILRLALNVRKLVRKILHRITQSFDMNPGKISWRCPILQATVYTSKNALQRKVDACQSLLQASLFQYSFYNYFACQFVFFFYGRVAESLTPACIAVSYQIDVKINGGRLLQLQYWDHSCTPLVGL